MSPKFRKISILLGDIAIFYSGLFLALCLRNGQIISTQTWSEHWPLFSIVFVLWIIILYITDMYDLTYAKNNQTFFIRSGITAIILTAVAVSFFYIQPNLRIAPKTILILDLVITLSLLNLWRIFFNTNAKNGGISLIAITSSDLGKKLLSDIEKNPQWGYQIRAIINPIGKPEFSPIPTFTKLTELSQLIQNTDSKLIVVDNDMYDSNVNILFDSGIAPDITIIPLTHLYEQIAQKIPIQTITKAWFLENISTRDYSIHDRLQRVFDIVFSIILLILTLPLYPIIALGIRLTSKGAVFYRQERLGYRGVSFMMIKFRTMVADAEKDGPKWAEKNDSRITRIGSFLRKTRLDELPQMMNILKGDMSFIGPRAERPAFIHILEKELPFYNQRLLVKPGASGWAQVNYKYGNTTEDAMEKLQYDLYYIKNRNWYLDVSIILKTIKIMTSFGGQ